MSLIFISRQKEETTHIMRGEGVSETRPYRRNGTIGNGIARHTNTRIGLPEGLAVAAEFEAVDVEEFEG